MLCAIEYAPVLRTALPPSTLLPSQLKRPLLDQTLRFQLYRRRPCKKFIREHEPGPYPVARTVRELALTTCSCIGMLHPGSDKAPIELNCLAVAVKVNFGVKLGWMVSGTQCFEACEKLRYQLRLLRCDVYVLCHVGRNVEQTHIRWRARLPCDTGARLIYWMRYVWREPPKPIILALGTNNKL